MLPLILAGAGAGMGLMKGMSNQKKNAEDARFRKAAIEFSPWTGMADPGRANRAGVMDSTFQGAMGGLGMGQSAAGALGSTPAVTPPAPAVQAAAVPTAQPLQFQGANMDAPLNVGGQSFTPKVLKPQVWNKMAGPQSEYGNYAST